jgi:hypothetical protein
MSIRMTNALIADAKGIGAAPNQKVANIIDGAQLGLGAHIPYLDGSTPLVMNPVVLVVTHTPAMWDLPGYEYNKAICKALIERHANSVSGIDFNYTLNVADAPVGLDGQQMGVPLNTTRSAVSPSFTWKELSGNLVWNFFYKWIKDIQHPDTHASLMSAMYTNNSGEGGGDIPDYIVSTYSMAMMAIQFDPTMDPDRIIDAAFYTAMFPTETGDIGFERQIATAKSPDRTIPFRAIVQHNHNTRELGKYIGKALQLHKPNYDLATTASGIHMNLREMGIDFERNLIQTDFKLQSEGGAYPINKETAYAERDVLGEGLSKQKKTGKGPSSTTVSANAAPAG